MFMEKSRCANYFSHCDLSFKKHAWGTPVPRREATRSAPQLGWGASQECKIISSSFFCFS